MVSTLRGEHETLRRITSAAVSYGVRLALKVRSCVAGSFESDVAGVADLIIDRRHLFPGRPIHRPQGALEWLSCFRRSGYRERAGSVSSEQKISDFLEPE